MALLGFGNATKDNFKDIAEDTLNYAFPTGMYFTWRNGELKGLTGWNYQQFLEQNPSLAVFYVNLCQGFWSIGFIVSIAASFVMMIYHRKLLLRFWLPVAGYVMLNALCFAVQGANVYDYKLALFPMALSYAWVLSIFFYANKYMEE